MAQQATILGAFACAATVVDNTGLLYRISGVAGESFMVQLANIDARGEVFINETISSQTKNEENPISMESERK